MLALQRHSPRYGPLELNGLPKRGSISATAKSYCLKLSMTDPVPGDVHMQDARRRIDEEGTGQTTTLVWAKELRRAVTPGSMPCSDTPHTFREVRHT